MITTENQALLAELGKNNHGRVLSAFLDEELRVLSEEKYDKIEKYWAREMTIDVINKLFSFLNRTNTQVDKKKTLYN